MSKYYGEKISPVLNEIADTMWEIDARDNLEPYCFTDDAFASALKIMMSVSMDRLWSNQEKSEMTIRDRLPQAEKLGNDLRKLFKDNLGIDTTKLYSKDETV